MQLDLRKIPKIKRKRNFPQLLTKEEIQAIFQSTKTLEYKAMFMLAYGSGLRLSEIINLRVCDIDSKQMRIFVSQGKGNKDRFTVLPQTTLEVLREYWLERRPKDWLFVRKNSGERPHKKTVHDSFKRTVQRAGIGKNATIHTLRHCFTTHLLNEGNDLYAINKLLGHSRLDTTSWYIHLTDSHTLRVQSPLDTMQEKPDA
jgi:site-specific recombinase XerD